VPYARTVKTASGAVAVQIVWPSRRESRSIEHLGSAHDDRELEALNADARQRLAAGQGELDLCLPARVSPAGRWIASSCMGHLWEALCRAYDRVGFGQATRAMTCSGSWCWRRSSNRQKAGLAAGAGRSRD
jgi:hypothetical protein